MRLTPHLAVAIAVVLFAPAFGASSVALPKPTSTLTSAVATIPDVASPTTAATPIPEPTALAPLAGMAIVALRRRRHGA